MAIPEDRRKRGNELLKKYRTAGNDAYSAASDAIADILLAISEDTDEGLRILHAAEQDFRGTLEQESFVGEG